MSNIIRKLASRKLWLAIAGVAAGIAMALGASSSEISSLAGAVTALISIVTYIITEGKIDAAAVGMSGGRSEEATAEEDALSPEAE
ncbi:MAG: hypothetical protein VB086_10045 [Clostridiaceae bacterium]|nr:hypothetical protein [Clostridiaceae bacterium]